MPEWRFYGRDEPLAELRRIVEAGRWFFCRIEGRRRIGKTTLLSQLARTRDDLGSQIVYMQTPDSDERDVAATFRRSLSEADHDDIRALKRTGRVSDPGGLNHRAAGCPAAQDDQTQYVHPFARLGINPVRLNTSTAGQAGREARGADPRRGSVRPSQASPTAEKRELDGRSLGTEAVRVLSGTAQRRVKSGCQ